ncbi:Nucleotidylyl transferase [Auriculariales sp. MPI-PUGE-AT-0066]|nr:Nucleotidylyl transferase [Auriculariales sp. MPI-PUGE-AT-0066]
MSLSADSAIDLATVVARVRGSQSLALTKVLGAPLSHAHHVMVLDSSFNPPTLAHSALASLPEPSITPDAILLLLSVTNADKVPKSSDATAEQRLEMMSLLAQSLYNKHVEPKLVPSEPVVSPTLHETGTRSLKTVAVGAIDAPTFVQKANILREALAVSRLRLSFGLGTDTIVRILHPQYYGGTVAGRDAALSALFDGSTQLVCADRPDLLPASDTNLIASAQTFVDDGYIRFIQLPEHVAGISSSAIRKHIAAVKVADRYDNRALHTVMDSTVADYILQNALYFT